MHLLMSLDRSGESQPQVIRTAAAARWLRAALVALGALASGHAHAQLSASAALVSEYSARGVSLSRGRPTPQLRIDYDAPSGWYAGALVSHVELPGEKSGAQLVAYGGYAQRLASGLTWEAGALDASFEHGQEYRYHEFYAGLTRDDLAARVYFSPSYYGGARTVYAEANASRLLRDRLTLLGHLGLLHVLGGGGGTRNWLDVRVALGLDLGAWNVQFAVVERTAGGRAPRARALAVSASHAF